MATALLGKRPTMMVSTTPMLIQPTSAIINGRARRSVGRNSPPDTAVRSEVLAGIFNRWKLEPTGFNLREGNRPAVVRHLSPHSRGIFECDIFEKSRQAMARRRSREETFSEDDRDVSEFANSRTAVVIAVPRRSQRLDVGLTL